MRQPGRLVDLHAHAVTQAVAEVLALAGRLDHRPGGGVDLAAAGAGPDGLQTGQLGREDQLVDLARLGARARRRRRCGCSPSSSRRARHPSRSPPARPRPTCDVAGAGVGQRTVGAGGDDRVKRRPLGSLGAHRRARASTASSRSVRPASPRSSSCVSAASAAAVAARIRSISSGSLTARRRSTRPPAADQLHPPGSSSRSRACWRTVTSASSKPSRSSPAGSASGTPSSSSCAALAALVARRPRPRPARRSESR